MNDLIKHTLEWLSLVVPGLGIAGGALFVLRGWMHRSIWRYFAALICGLMIIGGGTFLLTFGYGKYLAGRVATCEEASIIYDCQDEMIGAAYVAIIGLIALGGFLVMALGLGLRNLVTHRKVEIA